MLLVLTAITLYFLFRDQSIFIILKTLSKAKIGYIVIAIIFMGIYISLEGVSEALLINAVGSKLSVWRSIQITFVGFYFAAISPASSAGQPSQVYYLKKDGIDLSDASFGIIAFTLAYQIVLLSFVGFVLIFAHSFLADKIRGVTIALIYGFTVGSFLLVVLIALMISRKHVNKAVFLLINILSKVKIIKDKDMAQLKAKLQLDDYEICVQCIRKNPLLFVAVCLIAAVQLFCMFSVPYFAFRALGINEYSIFQVVALQAALHLSVCAIPLPGAIGASENAFFLIYSSVLPKPFMLPVLILSRGVSYFFYLFVSGIITIFTHISITKKANKYVKK